MGVQTCLHRTLLATPHSTVIREQEGPRKSELHSPWPQQASFVDLQTRRDLSNGGDRAALSLIPTSRGEGVKDGSGEKQRKSTEV